MDFNNSQVAFSAKSNAELRKAWFLFLLIKRPNAVKFFKFLANIAIKIGFPLGWIVKPTLFKLFVAGETLEQCKPILELLQSYNVMSVLDYSAEGGTSQKEILKTYNEIVNSIHFAAENSSVAYAVFKPSGLMKPTALTDKKEMELFRERFIALCKLAFNLNVRILVDAEHYANQELFDRLTEEAMELFNKERAIVFHTLQMYRHDRLAYLEKLYHHSRERGYILGIKFVRGAYMEEERELAFKERYPDPICPTKEATDLSYNNGLRFVIEHIEHFELFSGTHNYESNYLLANLIEEKELKKNDQRIYFSQLMGMSDNISFMLASKGFNVCKYLPYAPVKEVLPYLIRRAEENTSMAGQTSRELDLIKEEISRRKKEKKEAKG